ncbi:MAG: hypothetical protein CL943_02920 [Candidatus Diapherotrites archaeon]|uniref:Uncharacterized protein n=1 Tax=Candidatus Iainarchaeum sp. TaxID=3101447 RepID=A0A2D6M1D6_9ARCH|nr:hypothetical protein [Candidatus Diapherotrites archaeon]|tara:strand:- start:4358 stop:5017 length:660 start_codon:yes stop_codon:yes gene_type:complete
MAKDNIPRGQDGRFEEISPGVAKQVVRSILFSKRTIRQIAQKHGVSSAYVSNARDALRMYGGQAPHLNTREAALLEREYKVMQFIFNACHNAQQTGRKVPSAAKIKISADKVLLGITGSVSLKMVNRVLDTFAVQGIIPPRKKPGPRKQVSVNAQQDPIIKLIREKPAISNAELMRITRLTQSKLNLRLRKLRDLGVLPLRQRPGGKPFRKRRTRIKRK